MAIEIIVDSHDEKMALLEGSEEIHYLEDLDTDIPGCNTSAHLYCNPDSIKVRSQLSNPDCVPGRLRCAKCKFVLTKVNINMGTGTLGAGDNNSEPCPNGCGPLWPVSWEQEAKQGWEDMERLSEMYLVLKEQLKHE